MFQKHAVAPAGSFLNLPAGKCFSQLVSRLPHQLFARSPQTASKHPFSFEDMAKLKRLNEPD
jgi:hypothetical protein